ncbi:hypothetical protein D9758_008526 [Tetrapyrgos nigripes]|uniref:Carbonic anhydrase n=1 Tax=Tetrapyrgos nigripes TaxID=182062 RepID=A0A8H5G5R3_9AGAR|nr:hypothetical protein D9758_008526 [Tetrapyrgos nigripes]
MPSNEISPPIPSQDLLDRNAKYAEGHKAKIGAENWGHFPKTAIVSMGMSWKRSFESNANVNASPQKQLGLGDFDTTIIRNAGGGVGELTRSILITQKFGTRHFVVIKHSDCGYFYNSKDAIIEDFKAHAKDLNAIDAVVDKIPTNFGQLSVDNFALRDVEYLRKSPLIYPETKVTGWVFDDNTGKASPNLSSASVLIWSDADSLRKDSPGGVGHRTEPNDFSASPVFLGNTSMFTLCTI